MDMDKIPMKVKLDAFYTAICETADFIKDKILPKLDALRNAAKQTKKPLPSKKENLIALYWRICLWLDSIKILNHPRHFHTIASAGRAISELLVDMKLLIENKPKDAVRRINAFAEVEKYRIAKSYKNFKDANPSLKYTLARRREDFAKNTKVKERVENYKKEFWGKSRIEHWSGWNTRDRFREAGGKEYELLYVEYFMFWSWYVHPAGLTGVKGVSREGFESIFGISLLKIVELCCDATTLIGEYFAFKSDIPNFDDIIQRLKVEVAGEVLTKYEKISVH